MIKQHNLIKLISLLPLITALPAMASSYVPSNSNAGKSQSTAIGERIPAPSQEELEVSLKAAFMPAFTQGTVEDVEKLLAQGLHPNNSTSVKEMPKAWEALIKRAQTDKETALPIIRTMLAYAQKALPKVAPRSSGKKVVINMDVNGTIIFGDTEGGRTPEQSVLLALGDNIKDRWSDNIAEPISFAEFVNKHLLPGHSSDKELRKQRDKEKFALLEYLEKTNNPSLEATRSTYKQMVERLKEQKGAVVISLYKLIEYMDAKKINYSVLLRSFGVDTPEVAAQINKNLGKEFFKVRGDFRAMLRLMDALPSEERLANLRAVYKFITATENGGFRDDYPYWNTNGASAAFGKMFPIDPSDSSIIQIFFDDNVKTDPRSPDNIINPIDVRNGQPLKVSDLVESGNIVQANGVQALLDDEYFIKSIKALLEKQ